MERNRNVLDWFHVIWLYVCSYSGRKFVIKILYSCIVFLVPLKSNFCVSFVIGETKALCMYIKALSLVIGIN